MGDAITPLGKKWEYLHSIWILWLIFPFGFLSFISFYYISLRVRKLKWFIAGSIYALLVIQFFVVDEFYPKESFIYDASVMLILGGWIAAWINAVISRKTYLQLLVKQTKSEARRMSAPSYDIQETYSLDPSAESSQSVDTPKPVEEPINYNTSLPAEKVNMNTAAQKEIAAIPSLGNILAGQIVEIRKRRGPFHNFSHFVELMDIKPHILAKAKPFMVFSNEDLGDRESEHSTDHSKYSSGRVVDY
ncbi:MULTISPECIES: ComEA family DNA-binding protein [Oceanobacillus]|uniref:ComEA family DNA-binding protein n=1 Tax=Oceanobacillus TaxID=182709 RepID=UPI000B2488F8